MHLSEMQPLNICQMVHIMNELKPGVRVDKETVQIDHSVMFLRCTALEQREN